MYLNRPLDIGRRDANRDILLMFQLLIVVTILKIETYQNHDNEIVLVLF